MRTEKSDRLLVFLIAILTLFIFIRFENISSGSINLFDSILLILFSVLILSPLIEEIKFGGLSFKTELRELKNDIRDEIINLRTEINSNINVNPNIHISTGFSPDAQRKIAELNESQQQDDDVLKNFEAPDEVVELFKMRYSLEIKLMEIAELFYPETMGRDFTSMHEVIIRLQRDEYIDSEISKLFREFLNITNSAIHGVILNDFDMKLARKLGPALLSKLKGLE